MDIIKFEDKKFFRFMNRADAIVRAAENQAERESILNHYSEFIDDLYFYDMISDSDFFAGKRVIRNLKKQA